MDNCKTIGEVLKDIIPAEISEENNSTASVVINHVPKAKQQHTVADAEVTLSDVSDTETVSRKSKTTKITEKSTFEINLAEFPLTTLSKHSADVTVLRYNDTIYHDGEMIDRKWMVEARGKDEDGKDLGFGGQATLDVVYELFQIWNEQGFKNNRIVFGTYHQFLKRLGWGTGKPEYERLKYTLKCIHGLHISCPNGFYVRGNGYDVKVTEMYLFPEMYEYKDGYKADDPNARHCVVASDTLNKIMKNNKHFFPMPPEKFKKLSPAEKRLTLILSKYFTEYGKARRQSFRRNMYLLAGQIPIMSDSNKVIRQQLKKICDGLKGKIPFLSDYEIDGDNIIFYNDQQISLPLPEDKKNTRKKKKHDSYDYYLYQKQSDCISDTEADKPLFIKVAKYVPEYIVCDCIDEACRKGEDKVKLYTSLIMKYGEKYFKNKLKISVNAAYNLYKYLLDKYAQENPVKIHIDDIHKILQTEEEYKLIILGPELDKLIKEINDLDIYKITIKFSHVSGFDSKTKKFKFIVSPKDVVKQEEIFSE
jgi:hypothetical protein